MKILKIILYLFFLIFYDQSAFCQNFEWLKTYGTKFNNGNAAILGLSTNQKGITTFLLSVKGTNSDDSIVLPNFKYLIKKFDYSNFLINIDSNGSIEKAKFIGIFYAHSFCSDDSSNYYIMGYLSDSIDNQIVNETFNKKDGSILFIKLNNEFKTIWTKQTGNNNSFVFNNGYGTQAFRYNSKISVSKNQLFFIVLANKSIQIGDSNFNLNGARNFIFGELSMYTGNIKWSNYLVDNLNSSVQLSKIIKIENDIYLSGDNSTSNTKIDIIKKSDTLILPGSFIYKMDSLGSCKKLFNLHNKFPSCITDMETNGTDLFICGFYKDTMNWGSETITPAYPSNKSDNLLLEAYLACITINFEPKWFYRPNIISKTTSGFNSFNKLIFCNGFFYSTGLLYNSVLEINNSQLGKNSSGAYQDLLLIKYDKLGNVLWAADASSKNPIIYGLSNYDNKSVYLGGEYNDSITLNKIYNFSKGVNAFITKITDYDITRGKVKSGPYCAGDTILVPYTHIGDFDTSNYFIAELSDEKGEFMGKQRELGRLKTNLDSAVKGILPNFEISTSGNYRIRIRSTAPAIQSYFILDSLRLLIYSRDKADPGPADTICFMDTLQLNTFGGTKWIWSPAYFMDDSAVRQPNIWPDKDTTYQIIIADSSGCGLADTAYKKVVVRPRPTLVGDTLVYKCHDVNIKLKVLVKNSEFGHSVKWYRNNKLYFFNDSFTYVLNESSIFTVVLFENCSPVRDTLIIKVIYQNPATLKAIADTSVCFGSQLALKANATGNNAFAQFIWFNSSGQFIGEGAPIVTIIKTDSFKIVLADNCNLKADSTWYKITLNGQIQPLQNLLPNDTILCDATTLKLSLNNASTNDSIVWKDWQSNQILSTNKEYEVTNPIHLKTEVRNICGVTTDSLIVSYLTKPTPVLDSLYSPCQGTALPITVGKPNNQEKYLWSNNATTATTTYNQSGNHWVQVSNNCGTEFQYFKIAFATKPKALFNNTDVCEGQAFVLDNQSTQATGISYVWRLGDGTLDSGFAPVHIYKKTGNARTFLVSLHVASSKDCADSITLPINVNITPDASFDAAAQNKTVFFTPKNIDNQNTYKWYFGDGDSSNTKQPNHTYKADSGTYTVCLTLTNNSNCSSTFCQEVHFSVGINNLKAQGIAIYPNPTDGELIVEFSSQSVNNSIFLFNTLGQQVFEKHHLVSKQNLDISHLNKGVYWVKLVVDGVVWSSKVVVY